MHEENSYFAHDVAGGQEHHSPTTKQPNEGPARTSPALPYQSWYFEVKTTRQIVQSDALIAKQLLSLTLHFNIL